MGTIQSALMTMISLLNDSGRGSIWIAQTLLFSSGANPNVFNKFKTWCNIDRIQVEQIGETFLFAIHGVGINSKLQ